jgi:hypothetical protein
MGDVAEGDVVSRTRPQREFIRPYEHPRCGDDRAFLTCSSGGRVRQIHGVARGEARAVAGWIRDIAGERVSDLAEVLAHHHLEQSLAGRRRPS